MSLIATAVAAAMVKQAAYASQAKERNFTPKRPERPHMQKEQTGNYVYKSGENGGKGNELIQWGKNTANYNKYMPLTENRTLDFHNTISGTGHGRPYWEEKDNPYET